MSTDFILLISSKHKCSGKTVCSVFTQVKLLRQLYECEQTRDMWQDKARSPGHILNNTVTCIDALTNGTICRIIRQFVRDE